MTVHKECSYPQKCACICLWIVAIIYSHEIVNCVYMHMNVIILAVLVHTQLEATGLADRLFVLCLQSGWR